MWMTCVFLFFFFQAEDGIRDADVTGVQTCALPILPLEIALQPRALAAVEERSREARVSRRAVLLSRERRPRLPSAAVRRGRKAAALCADVVVFAVASRGGEASAPRRQSRSVRDVERGTAWQSRLSPVPRIAAGIVCTRRDHVGTPHCVRVWL